MTNYEYLKVCDLEDMAEILTALLVEIWEECYGKVMSENQIAENCIAMEEWLNSSVISGSELN